MGIGECKQKKEKWGWYIDEKEKGERHIRKVEQDKEYKGVCDWLVEIDEWILHTPPL